MVISQELDRFLSQEAVGKMKTLGQILKSKREREHWVLRDMAYNLHCTEGFLSRLESDERLPDTTRLPRIFRTLAENDPQFRLEFLTWMFMFLHENAKGKTGKKAAMTTAMTTDEAIDQFLEYMEVEKGAAPLTIKVYRHYLKRFSEWLAETSPGIKPEDIDMELVRKYRLYLSRITGPDGLPLKKITQSYHIIALRARLRYLVVQRNISTLPPEKIDLPKVAARTVTFLNPDQLQRLLNSPDTSDVIGLRDRAILETLFSTGLRVSELARLNRDQVDLERKEFGVVGKGSKPRVVFLSDSAAEWIRRYLDTREDHFKPLFIRYSGGVDMSKDGQNMRLTSRSIQLIVAKYARMCGLPVKATPHTLRHSFATDLLSAGADIRSVQEMLGHESIRTTQVYTHVTDRQLREVHRSFHGRKKEDGGVPEDVPPEHSS